MILKNMFKKYGRRVAAAAVITLAMGNAMANEIFTFSFSNATAAGYGTLDTLDNGDGSFTAVSGSGVVTANGITDVLTLLFNPNGTALAFSPEHFSYDNQLFLNAAPLIDTFGLLFMSGTKVTNLFFDQGGYVLFQQDGRIEYYDDFVSLSVARVVDVPEPASALLLGAGLLGLTLTRRTRRN